MNRAEYEETVSKLRKMQAAGEAPGPAVSPACPAGGMNRAEYEETVSKLREMQASGKAPGPAVSEVAAPAPVRTVGCILTRCCGCISLATGIALLASFDLVAGIAQLFVAAGILLARVHEHAIDESLLSGAFSNSTAAYAQHAIETVNRHIDIGAALSPELILLALISVVAGALGLRAAKGDVAAARKFYAWKLARFGYSALVALFMRTGLSSVLLAGYFALVARSWWVQLRATEAVLPVTMPVTDNAQTTQPVVFIGKVVN